MERVNHPDYYKGTEDGREHPECIELLEIITQGLPSILAFDLGQLKYCYRFGSKAEEGLTKKQKAVEDVKKVIWYLTDFVGRYNYYNFEKIENNLYYNTVATLVAEEFAYNKPTEEIKNATRKLIKQVFIAKTKDYDKDFLINAANNLLAAVDKSNYEDWR